jgi:hypothetical protein
MMTDQWSNEHLLDWLQPQITDLKVKEQRWYSLLTAQTQKKQYGPVL